MIVLFIPPGIGTLLTKSLSFPAYFPTPLTKLPTIPPDLEILASSAAASADLPAFDNFITPFKAFALGAPIFKAPITGFAIKSPAYGIAETNDKNPNR